MINNALNANTSTPLSYLYGGTGASTYATGDILYSSATNVLSKLTGNITTAKQYLSQTGSGAASAAPAWATVSGADVTGAALTRVDDTNVTATLGGTPATALLRATSITLGWTGQLAVSRGGTSLASLTAFNLIVGNGTGTPALVAPSATSGIPLVSQGAASNPAYSTAVVAGGGTGNTTFTAYSVICAGTTATGAFQNVSGVGTANQVLVSNGASALPTWQAVPGLVPSALTRTDDTNVTLTLGGSPTVALLAATSITAGWTGQLSVPRGGTGNSTFTAYSVVCAGTTATGTFQNVSGLGSSGQVLTSNGAAALPTWQNTTGTGTVNSGTQNQLAWYAANGSTVSGLTTANNGILVTSAGGVPSIGNTVGAGLTMPSVRLSDTGILDNNGVSMITFSAQASAVNYFNLVNNTAGNGPIIQATGSDSDVQLQLYAKGAGVVLTRTTSTTGLRMSSGTGVQHQTNFIYADTAVTRNVTFPDATGTVLMTGVAISTVPSIAFSSTSGVIGTTTNDDAAAGSVGEMISSVIQDASAVSLTTTTIANITSISLTAGDWDIYGNATFIPDSSTVLTYCRGWISSTSITLPDRSVQYSATFGTGETAAVAVGGCVPGFRVRLSGTTTYYLSAQSSFTTSTNVVCGGIYARRRR